MPFAGYADFAACVAANSDKGDPNAYCGHIKHQVEGKSDQGHTFDELPQAAQAMWLSSFQEYMRKGEADDAGRVAWASVYRRYEKLPGGWSPLKAFAEVEFKSIYKSERIIYGSASIALVDAD